MSTTSAFLASSTAAFFLASSPPPWRRKPGSKPTSFRPLPDLMTERAQSSLVGLTMLEPAPWYRGVWAKSPMTATEAPAFRGRILSSFFSSTMVCSAALRAMAWWASTSNSLGASAGMTVAKSTFRYSSSRWSITSSDRVPAFTAATSSRSLLPPVAGISRALPQRAPSARSLLPPQSVTTKPSKPHWSTRMSRSSSLSSLAYLPLIRL